MEQGNGGYSDLSGSNSVLENAHIFFQRTHRALFSRLPLLCGKFTDWLFHPVEAAICH
jgi:hypothetical protein